LGVQRPSFQNQEKATSRLWRLSASSRCRGGTSAARAAGPQKPLFPETGIAETARYRHLGDALHNALTVNLHAIMLVA
jgi:hypothetical protein